MASLALQGFTAFMVYQMMVSKGGTQKSVDDDVDGKASATPTSKSGNHSTAEKAAVSPVEERSIRGTNLYGPYKKVRLPL